MARAGRGRRPTTTSRRGRRDGALERSASTATSRGTQRRREDADPHALLRRRARREGARRVAPRAAAGLDGLQPARALRHGGDVLRAERDADAPPRRRRRGAARTRATSSSARAALAGMHTFTNPTDEPARILAVSTAPTPRSCSIPSSASCSSSRATRSRRRPKATTPESSRRSTGRRRKNDLTLRAPTRIVRRPCCAGT